MFVYHPENDVDKLDPEIAHSEGLGTRISRPQPRASCQFPEMLSVPGKAIYRGDVPFLLNVNHKGVQFVTPFSKFTMTMYYDFWRILLEDFSKYMSPFPSLQWQCLIHMVTINKHFSFGFICTSFLRELFIHSNLLWRRLHFSSNAHVNHVRSKMACQSILQILPTK